MQLKPLSLGKVQDWMAYQWRYTKPYDSLLLKQDTIGKYKDPVLLKASYISVL
jgi:hypothetical protein